MCVSELDTDVIWYLYTTGGLGAVQAFSRHGEYQGGCVHELLQTLEAAGPADHGDKAHVRSLLGLSAAL